jgi:hypothetical protein
MRPAPKPAAVSRSTELPIDAELACWLAQKPAMFRHVVWPVFGVRDLPASLAEGEELSTRLYWLTLIPAWTHTLRLISVTPRTMYSNEHGGMVRQWNHRLTFEPISATSCRYTDEVEIDAGLATPLVVAFARFIYRWRQHRWRHVASLLASGGAE